MSRINQDSETQDERSSYAYIGDNTGAKVTVRKSASPFYGTQNFYLEFSLSGDYLRGYGWDPQHAAHVVRIVYRRLDQHGKNTAEPAVVAGYISVKNVNLSSVFSQDSKYRIGVDVNDLADSLAARIDLAKKLIKQAEDKQQMGLQRKLDILETKLEVTLKYLIDAGWTHVILATGWRELLGREKFVDRLDINLDFFNFFYPEKAFPIGNISEYAWEKWVGRDKILWQLFPEGELVQSTTKKGRKLQNRYELKIGKSVSQQFPNLKVTFNYTANDVWSQESSEKTKLVTSKKWPTVDEVVEDNEKNLQTQPYGDEAEKARSKALKWAEKFLIQSVRLQKKGKKKLAQKNEDAAQRLWKAVARSCEKEQEKLISDVDNITDSTSDALIKAGIKAVNGMKKIQMLGGDEDGKASERTMNSLARKYEDRFDKQLENLKIASPDSPEIIRLTQELLKSQEAIQMTEGDTNQESKINKWIATNASKLEERYKINPALDDVMKSLIRIQLLVLGSTLPKSLLGDTEIKSYVEELQRHAREKAEKELQSLPEPEIAQIKGKDLESKVIPKAVQ